jgi:hypothetical protein
MVPASSTHGTINDVATNLPHLQSKWLKSQRTYLAKIDGKLVLDDPYIPTRQQNQDIYLMDAALADPAFKPASICKLNYCHLYLQAFTLLYISDTRGTHLDLAMLHGHSAATSSTSTWHHFKQDLLDLDLWRLWRRLCKKWALPDGTLSWALVSQSQHPPSIVGVLLCLARNCIEVMA